MTPASASRDDRARDTGQGEAGQGRRSSDRGIEGAALTVAAVARRLGVAPATLRTWDRRYGLGPSEHIAGAHRRYTAADTERLLVMRRLTLEGVAPNEAARVARTSGPDVGEPEAHGHETSQRGHREPGGEADDQHPFAAQWAPASRASSAVWGGGPMDRIARRGSSQHEGSGRHEGSVHSEGPVRSEGSVRHEGSVQPGASEQRFTGGRAISPAAVDTSTLELLARAHDMHGLSGALVAGLTGRDVASWWTDLVEPAAHALESTTAVRGVGEDPQAVLGTAVLIALRSRFAPTRPGPTTPPLILVRPATGAIPTMAAHALAAASEAAGVAAGVLPAGAASLVEAVAQVRPRAVVMLGLSQESDDVALVRALHDAEPELPVFVSPGPGDAIDQLPWGANLHRVRTFTGALHEVLAVCS